jgi:hypothetical protein
MKYQLDATLQYFISCMSESQHVSGAHPPIIRRFQSLAAQAASGEVTSCSGLSSPRLGRNLLTILIGFTLHIDMFEEK